MKKINISNLDLDLYYYKFENNLEIYMIPKNNVNSVYTTYTCKFGSNNICYYKNDKEINVPFGIAHFLEHKMFEQKDGSSPFEKFDKNGANSNAFTNYKQTTYLWGGPNKFEENMKILLNFVNNPYFTDENVEKEKGIIIQELKMYDDSPFRYGIQKITDNAFVNHPIKVDVGGTIKSVTDITKEDLYECYNTFYNPNNMFITITGNFDPYNAIKIIKKYYKKENLENKIKLKKYNEPDIVSKEKKIIKMNVTIPKILFGIKLNMSYSNLLYREYKQYISLYMDSIIGPTSELSEKLKNNNIITDDLEYYLEDADEHLLIVILAESKDTKKLAKEIKKEIGKIPDKNTFNRKLKCFLSILINSTDSIIGINNIVTSSIINNGIFNTDFYNQVKSLNYNEFVNLIKNTDFSNQTILYINQLKEK